MAKRAEPPILDIDLGKNGGRLVAKTLDDVEEWIQGEREHWGWLSGITPRVNEFQQLWKEWTTAWGQTSRATAQIKSQEGPPPDRQQMEGFGASLIELYTTKEIIHSSTPEAKFIEDLRESESNLTAASALAYLLNRQFPLNQHEMQTGALEAFFFEKGIRSRAASEKKALEQLRAKWQENLNKYSDESESLIDSTSTLNRELRASLEAATESLSAYSIEKQQEFSDLFSTTSDQLSFVRSKTDKSLETLRSVAEDKLNYLITTFDEKLSLQAPVTYWTQKRKYHKEQKGIMLKQIAIGGAIGLAALITAGTFVLAGQAKPPPLNYLFLVLLMSAILWILRIGVKLYLSHAHLEADAYERVILVHSYLAFLRRGKGVEDTDRQIILESLFRHSSTGLQKDDGGNPHIVLELLERMKGKG